ncbi:unnamed protein product [Paramecium sonneborni]|uniref:Uncharacterized protein n=1 Tax=Paramecium sonneborni TaxID=65129 RepID=A0A8S1P791_9CILI|nr:unnamed protein product [Paramecium sonneborni]
MSYSYSFKLILIGDSSVGKSCLVKQCNSKCIKNNDVTICMEISTSIIMLEDQSIQLQIWDTAGSETYRSITRSYYRSTAGVIIVYDITNKESFKNVSQWFEDVKEHGNNPQMTFTIVGNKSDLEADRQVSKGEAITFARNNDMEFIEVSALIGNYVEDVFLKTAKQILEKINKNEIDPQNEIHGIKIGRENGIDDSFISNNNNTQQLQSKSKDQEKKSCC